jgi:hypothetical protein
MQPLVVAAHVSRISASSLFMQDVERHLQSVGVCQGHRGTACNW